MEASTDAPLVAHVVHRLDTGGLENGVVNLINRMPEGRFRHAVVSMTECTEFGRRIEKDVRLVSLHKRPGKDIPLYWRLWRTFRALRPAIVHTRNLSTLEAQVPAWLAGVPARVHGEHGWDVWDLGGINRRYIRLRRIVRPLIDRYIPLSRELEGYLLEKIDARPERVSRICNGVDTEIFRPRREGDASPLPERIAAGGTIVIGTVGRLEEVKDPLNLVGAFLELRDRDPAWRDRLRLVVVGDGSLRDDVARRLRAAGAENVSWLAGSRSDVPDLLRALDLFVLPSQAEGISNTILEAMASGLPVVATRVGGNPELVEEGRTANLSPPGDHRALADAIEPYLEAPDRLRSHGAAGRARVEERFSIGAMVEQYLGVYDAVLGRTE